MAASSRHGTGAMNFARRRRSGLDRSSGLELGPNCRRRASASPELNPDASFGALAGSATRIPEPISSPDETLALGQPARPDVVASVSVMGLGAVLCCLQAV